MSDTRGMARRSDRGAEGGHAWPEIGPNPPPRFASYPTPDVFAPLEPGDAARWLGTLQPGDTVSTYMHVPFCPRLCWWCACRAELAAPGRPGEHAEALVREVALVAAALPAGMRLGRMHLGGGSPVMLGGARLGRLADALIAALPPAADAEIVLETAAFDHDSETEAAVAALAARLPVRVVLGLGAPGGPEGDRPARAETAAIAALRRAGAGALTVEMLAGLPGETRTGFARRLAAVLKGVPERVVLTPWAHAPARARRQARLAAAPPDPAARAHQAAEAAAILADAGYRRLGPGTWVQPGDALLAAAAADRLAWGFDGLSARSGEAVIGLGPSAVSQLPDGLVQNPAAYAAWRRLVTAGRLAGWRGHAYTPETRLIADLVSDLVCRGRVEIDRLRRRHGAAAEMFAPAVARLIAEAPEGALVPLAGVSGGPGFLLTTQGLDGAQRCAKAILADLSRDAPRPATRLRGALVG